VIGQQPVSQADCGGNGHLDQPIRADLYHPSGQSAAVSDAVQTHRACHYAADAPSAQPNRGLMMPRRKSTREHDRAQRIEAERARNREIRDNPETACDDAYFPSRPPPGEDEDPPPF
jgi:hypothetical protein